jgi:hypothetical protein
MSSMATVAIVRVIVRKERASQSRSEGRREPGCAGNDAIERHNRW